MRPGRVLLIMQSKTQSSASGADPKGPRRCLLILEARRLGIHPADGEQLIRALCRGPQGARIRICQAMDSGADPVRTGGVANREAAVSGHALELNDPNVGGVKSL